MKLLLNSLRLAARVLFAAFTLGLLLTTIAYLYLAPGLPTIESIQDMRLQVPLRVYAKSGDLIAEFGEKRRIPLAIKDVPERMVQAVLAAEDDRFFEHPGVDYQGLLRAVVHLVKTGDKGQGGSTITMQVARNFFLSREKTYLRKLNEIFLALKIERELTKENILGLYLNKIYLGNRAYGVAAAARIYYGKPINELSTAELAMIAGLPKAPSRYNPIVNQRRAMIRRG
ncbi:MAG: transglycosylase domain-containing protein, partial [Gammaproteobacteria bacterium]|nr:transglycosylase domain-containing protein [Gammaproteobacteria bacterium]